MSLLLVAALFPLFFAAALSILLIALRLVATFNRQPGCFAFFHPYCNAGGGGERVLWRAITAMEQRFAPTHPNLRFVVYTGDTDATPEQILAKARSRFGLVVSAEHLEFVYLRWRWLLEPCNYPRLTLIAQMFAGLALGMEALWLRCPEWFIDTTGCPLTLPLFYWCAGAKTLSYVHYPTITREMVQLVDSRTAAYNNSATIAASAWLSGAKALYYRCVGWLYYACGCYSQLTMANGSWTGAHLSELWACRPRIVFPPCDTEHLAGLEQRAEQRAAEQPDGPVWLLSVGQIRPEKNHLEQLRIFAEVRRALKEEGSEQKVKLVIAGGCRDEGDMRRVEFLQNYALGNFQMTSSGANTDINWQLNVPFDKLQTLLQTSMVGLHTMWNEHFGISVVEGMAAGTIMVAHNSGGPKLDIIGGGGGGDGRETAAEGDDNSPCGFLATTREEYAAAILGILRMRPADRERIRTAARRKAARFSDAAFDRAFCDAIAPIMEQRQ